jgi:SAM-dependent methyltransferase
MWWIFLILLILIIIYAFTISGSGVLAKDFKTVPFVGAAILDVRTVDKIQFVGLDGKIGEYKSDRELYRDWKTKKQISQIMTRGEKVDKMGLILLMTKMLPHVPELKVINKLFAVKNDQDFYENFFMKHYKPVDQADRAPVRANLAFKQLKFLKIPPGQKMLEIGCGDGAITAELNKYLNLSEIHCIEIMTPTDSKGIIYHKPEQMLKFQNDYFDIIYCSLSLHHIDDIINTIRQMYRVIKPGGFVILREHNSADVFDAMIIEIEHICYILGNDGKKWKDIGEGYGLPTIFPNSFGWDKIMQPFVWYSYNDEIIRFKKAILSPTKIGWMVYTKPVE